MTCIKKHPFQTTGMLKNWNRTSLVSPANTHFWFGFRKKCILISIQCFFCFKNNCDSNNNYEQWCQLKRLFFFLCFFFALWITLLQCISMWLSISSLWHEGFSVIHWHLHSTLYLIAFEDLPSLTSKLVQWEHCQSSRQTEKELPLHRQNVQPLCSFVSSELLTPVRVLTCFYPLDLKKKKNAKVTCRCWCWYDWNAKNGLLHIGHLSPGLSCVSRGIRLALCPLAPGEASLACPFPPQIQMARYPQREPTKWVK